MAKFKWHKYSMILTTTLYEYAKLKRDEDAPYAIFVPNYNSSHLIVYFGSYNGEFRGDQTISATKSNGLFVRSGCGTWYIEDHPLGSTPIDVANSLTEFIKQYDHIKTITLAGFSMGAFAALLYSTWMNADKVMANVPQTKVPTTLVHTTIPSDQIPKQLVEFSSIKQVWTKYGSPDSNVVIKCCNKCDDNEIFKDIVDATDLIDFPCVSLIKYNCTGHKEISKHLLTDSYNESFML